MAIMIPSKPREYDERSQEDKIFKALSLLSNEYYVIHSFCITTIIDNIINENETDFIVFNPKKGILVIEAKAGNVSYYDDEWRYEGGRPMSHRGPYKQASLGKHNLYNLIEQKNYNLISRCKFLHTVWFPSLSYNEIQKIDFPEDAAPLKDYTLSKDDLTNPSNMIEKIFSLDVPRRIQTKLSESDTKQILNIFCKTFNVFPSVNIENDLTEIKFYHLLQEQLQVLYFLNGQKTVAVNGAAGTGKTIIACERAKQLAEQGLKVLFLCYNTFLYEKLTNDYKNFPLIHFTTLNGFVKQLTGNGNDYSKAAYILNQNTNKFEYDHVIIDEAQDFGMDDIEESGLINTIFNIITIERENGSFYCFYDKLQMINNSKIPEFINESDCKISLFKNCRNTTNIAKTSLLPVVDEKENRRLQYLDRTNIGKTPRFFFCEKKSITQCLDSIINDLIINRHMEEKDIVILTLETQEKSLIPNSNNLYNNKIKFTTTRKFKGLEARSIVLVDFDYDIFREDKLLRYYVGASRAKESLDIISTMTNDECISLLENHFNKEGIKPKHAQNEFVKGFQALKKSYMDL